MSIFSKSLVQNNPQRNPFDLSKRVLFSGQCGMLQPIYHKYVEPGCHLKINVSSLTRTLPLNTDAFARLREYVDFFFVPYRLLYDKFPDWVIQNSKPVHSDKSGQDLPFSTSLPYMDMQNVVSNIAFGPSATDDLGFPYQLGAIRLMDMLGYGQYYGIDFGDSTDLPPSMYVNCLNACAYQRIYADFYRDSHWEDKDIKSYDLSSFGAATVPSAMNVDSTLNGLSSAFFKIRYANYKKDILLGSHPSKQFGSVSIVPLNSGAPFRIRTNEAGANGTASVLANGNIGTSGTSRDFQFYQGNSTTPVGLSILDLRMAQALQKWKEVTETNGFRYNEQVQAHFGFKVPDSRAQIAEFIDGWTNTINISEVVNTAQNQGNISGKGVGVNQSHEIEFTASEHGVIMAIWHVAPDVDYNQSRLDFDNTMLDYEDFIIPEYQNLGMSDLQAFNFLYQHSNSAQPPQNTSFAYQLRYADKKSDLDECMCAFTQDAGLSSELSWVTPFQNWSYTALSQSVQIDYRFFKVPPTAADNLFTVASNGNVARDKFRCNYYFDVKAVRSLSVDGMPY